MCDDANVDEELRRVLAEAFPSRESLKGLLEGEFGADAVGDVPDDPAVSGYASNLVQWASSRGRRDDLLLTALKAQKYNQRLLRLAERLGLEPARGEQHGELRPLGPPGVLVRTLAVQPGDSPTLYVGAWGQQGVFRSDNSGLLWRPKSKGLTDLNINYIALSPHDNRVFAATDSGVCVSYNRGDSWEPQKDDFTKSRVMFVLLSPSEPGFFMAGTLVSSSGASVSSGTAAGLFSEGERELSLSLGVTPGRLHVSRDAGESWASADLKNPNHAAFCPSDARVIYVASGDNGLFKITLSQNIGIEFIKSFPTNSQPIYVAVCPTDADRLAVGTLNGLYLSDDGGSSWRAAEEIGRAQVSGITFQLGGEALLVSSSEGVFESLDGGKCWSKARGDSFFPWCMALAQTNDGAAFVGTSGMGVYRRAKGQKDWSSRNDGFPPAGGWLSAVAAPSGATYVGGVYGLYRSLDEGHSWDMLGFDDDMVTVMAVGPAPEQTPRPAPAGGLLVSSDGGLTVRPLDVQQRETLYVGTASGRVLRSSHTGSSWEQLFEGVLGERQYPVRRLSDGHVRELFVTGDDTSELYALLGIVGLFHSRDAGRSWYRLGEQTLPPGLNTLHVSAREAGRVIIGYVGGRSDEGRGGILWSEDAGRTWSESAGVSDAVTSICESAQTPGRVYATTTSRAVYRSSDGGRSFEQLRAPEHKVFRWVTMLVCPDDESVIWLGSSEGILRSRDAGKTWEQLDGGLIGETYYVNRLSYSRGWLYVAMKDGAFKTAACGARD